MRYADYKDSGIEWIGEIPQGWKITQVSKLYNVILGKMLCSLPMSDTDTLENYLCSANIKFEGIKIDEIKQMYFSKEDKKLYLLKKGDIVVSEGGDAGTTSIYQDEAYPCYIQNAVYKISTINPKENINKFLYYWLFFCKKCGYIDLICNRATIMHYTKEKLSKTPIIYTTKDEQQQIANYLDKKCAQINRVVEIQKSIIERLKEYKQSVITEAVTKGLDKSVPLKDSGIEWIGKIPQGWSISKIKHEFEMQMGKTPDTKNSNYYEGDNKWATIADINTPIIYDTETKITNDAIKDCSMDISPKGSLLFSFKLSIGKVAFCGEDLYTNEAIATFLSNKNSLKYLYYIAPIFVIKNAKENIYGAKLLNQQLINNAEILLPPIQEQQQIANYLDKKCAQIDKMIADKELMIEKLLEYKKSLIYECVTGKRKVV